MVATFAETHLRLASFATTFCILLSISPAALAASHEPKKVAVLAMSTDTTEEQVIKPAAHLPKVLPKEQAPKEQAKELFGPEHNKDYKDTLIKRGARISDTERLVRLKVKRSLRGKWKKQYLKVSRTIINEAKKHGLDPFFLMAVISHESSFDPLVEGTHTEIGLMQLKPKTAEWICDRFDMDWKGANSLRDPNTNIQIGAAYLSHLREKFDSKGKLYLEAYNVGPNYMRKAIARREIPKKYATQVMGYYLHYYLDLKELFEEPSAETAQF